MIAVLLTLFLVFLSLLLLLFFTLIWSHEPEIKLNCLALLINQTLFLHLVLSAFIIL